MRVVFEAAIQSATKNHDNNIIFVWNQYLRSSGSNYHRIVESNAVIAVIGPLVVLEIMVISWIYGGDFELLRVLKPQER